MVLSIFTCLLGVNLIGVPGSPGELDMLRTLFKRELEMILSVVDLLLRLKLFLELGDFTSLR
jgi:hypothetical protein